MVKSYTSLRQDINMFKDLKEIMNIMREKIEDLIIEVETIPVSLFISNCQSVDQHLSAA